MKVVLNQDVSKLGYRGDIIDVKAGYFRNFLFPNDLADYGSASRISIAEKRKEKMVMRKQEVLENAKDVVGKLEGLKLKLTAKASDKGKLFGSISNIDIAKAIKAELKMDFDSAFIEMEPLKELGEHKVSIKLGENTSATVLVTIEAL